MHLDTHVIVWLVEGSLDKFPVAALQRLNEEPLFISPMVRFELHLLHELKRIGPPAPDVVLAELADRLGVDVSATPWDKVIQRAAGLSWTRDPFDRLIAAHALVDGDTLLTRDRHLHAHLTNAVWD